LSSNSFVNKPISGFDKRPIHTPDGSPAIAWRHWFEGMLQRNVFFDVDTQTCLTIPV
jgi:hypothetical protein